MRIVKKLFYLRFFLFLPFFSTSLFDSAVLLQMKRSYVKQLTDGIPSLVEQVERTLERLRCIVYIHTFIREQQLFDYVRSFSFNMSI